MRRAGRGILIVGTMMCVGAGLGPPRVGLAEEAAPVPASAPAPWYEQIAVNGFVSTSYGYNFNQQPNRFRVFDLSNNSLTLDVFELAFQKSATKPRETGFRADVVFGEWVPSVSAARGLFDDHGNLDLQQAFATYVAPVGSGLKLDFGKFVTPFGYEVIDGYDGWNDNATRSFLFGYAIPFTHTGARGAYAFSSRVATTLLVVNGWDNAVDNNKSKSVGAQLALTPVEPLAVYVTAMTGPERDDHESDPRTLLDLVATWRVADRVRLGTNLDWAVEQDALGPGQDARWSGIAGYGRVGPIGAFTFSLRGESFDDRDGARTGTAQTLSEVTFTPEVHVSPSFIVRADLRLDRSDRQVFLDEDSSPTKKQTTVLVNALFHF